MVNLPFQKEQLGNAKLAEWRGFGVTCPQALVFSSSKKSAAAAAGKCVGTGLKNSGGVLGENVGGQQPAAVQLPADDGLSEATAAAAAGSGQCGGGKATVAKESCTADGMYAESADDAAAGSAAAAAAAAGSDQAAADISADVASSCGSHSYTAEVLAEHVIKVGKPDFAGAVSICSHHCRIAWLSICM
jgi:hypothetical protein